MDWVPLAIFGAVYVTMFLGRFPGLALDRTGAALLGAIALLVSGRVTSQAAWSAIHVPTIGLLLGLMVVSAQLRIAGLYTAVSMRIADARVGPRVLLLLMSLAAAGLSAVLANDIVCLAFTPVVIESCLRRGLRPLPFVLGLACAANIGSAATLIGNPQNMLIGQTLGLHFAGYLADAGVPAVAGVLAAWGIIVWRTGAAWHVEAQRAVGPTNSLDRAQAAKGMLILGALLLGFLALDVPREVQALTAAGCLLLSRRMRSRDALALVDWQLLVLFAGLFVVQHALVVSGWLERGVSALAVAGVDVRQPVWLFLVTVVLSNLVSNVPAVMLLLPTATHPLAGPVLALASTLAGNLLLVGSIANLIVADQSERLGVRMGWREHARVGVPVTAATLVIAGAWLAGRVLWSR